MHSKAYRPLAAYLVSDAIPKITADRNPGHVCAISEHGSCVLKSDPEVLRTQVSLPTLLPFALSRAEYARAHVLSHRRAHCSHSVIQEVDAAGTIPTASCQGLFVHPSRNAERIPKRGSRLQKRSLFTSHGGSGSREPDRESRRLSVCHQSMPTCTRCLQIS